MSGPDKLRITGSSLNQKNMIVRPTSAGALERKVDDYAFNSKTKPEKIGLGATLALGSTVYHTTKRTAGAVRRQLPIYLGGGGVVKIPQTELELPETRTNTVRLIRAQKQANKTAAELKLFENGPCYAARTMLGAAHDVFAEIPQLPRHEDIEFEEKQPKSARFAGSTSNSQRTDELFRKIMTTSEAFTGSPTVATAKHFDNARAVFCSWADNACARRGVDSSVKLAGDNPIAFDGVWCATLLGEVQNTTSHHKPDCPSVFRTLSSMFLLAKAVESLVPEPSRPLLGRLLGELYRSLFDNSCETLVSATEVLPGIENFPLASQELKQALLRGRLVSESLYLSRLAADEADRANARDIDRIMHAHARDFDLLVRRVDAINLSKLRMIMHAWRSVVVKARVARTRATGIVVRLSERVLRALASAVFCALRENVAVAKERRKNLDFHEAQSKWRAKEAALSEEVSDLRATIALMRTEYEQNTRDTAESHDREMQALKQSHVEADKEMVRLKQVVEDIKDEIAKVQAENRRWALVTNKLLREVTPAIEKRSCVGWETLDSVMQSAQQVQSPGKKKKHPAPEPPSVNELLLRHPETALLTGPDFSPVTTYTSLTNVFDHPSPPQKILLLFANYILRQHVPSHPPIENFGRDLSDSVVYLAILGAMYPSAIDVQHFLQSTTPPQRADKVVSFCSILGIPELASSADILLGIPLRNLSLLSGLFHLYASPLRFGTSDEDHACLNDRRGALNNFSTAMKRAIGKNALGSFRSSGGSSSRRGSVQRTADSGSEMSTSSDTDEENDEARGITDAKGGVRGDGVKQHRRMVRAAAPLWRDVDRVRWEYRPTPEQLELAWKKREKAKDNEEVDSGYGMIKPEAKESQKTHESAAKPQTLYVNTSIDDLEGRAVTTIHRNRAWQALSEIVQRDLLIRMHHCRSFDSGELLDEKSMRHMDWFLEVDEDRLQALLAQIVLQRKTLLQQLIEKEAEEDFTERQKEKLISPKNELEKVRAVFAHYYGDLRSLYHGYATMDPGSRLSQPALLQMLRDAGLLPPPLAGNAGQQAVKQNAKAINVLEDALRQIFTDTVATGFDESSSSSPRKSAVLNFPLFSPTMNEKQRKKAHSAVLQWQLSPQQFLFLLCFLAWKRHGVIQTQSPLWARPDEAEQQKPLSQRLPYLTLHRALKRLIVEDFIGPGSSCIGSGVDRFRNQVRHPSVLNVFRKSIKTLQKVYKHYSQPEVSSKIAKQPATGPDKQNGMLVDDFSRFCRDFKMLTENQKWIDVQTMVAGIIAGDDERLELVMEEARARAQAAFSNTDNEGPIAPTFELEVAQPEQKLAGLSFAEFLDAIAGVALLRQPIPTLPAAAAVGSFFRDVLANRLKES